MMKKSSIFCFLEQHVQLNASHFAERDVALLSYIDTIAPVEEAQRTQFFKEFVNGAYVFIPDAGNSYQAFANIEQNELINRNSSSSHHSIDTQFAFRSDVLGECLFGTREMGSQKGSWIQLEAYHTTLTQMPAHLYTYAVYIVTGENSGPMGTSSFTEAKPYILQTTIDPLVQTETFDMQMCPLVAKSEPITLSEVFQDNNSSPNAVLLNEAIVPMQVMPDLLTPMVLTTEILA
jgi:hypothetical protein